MSAALKAAATGASRVMNVLNRCRIVAVEKILLTTTFLNPFGSLG
jgi:hypothetical protein